MPVRGPPGKLPCDEDGKGLVCTGLFCQTLARIMQSPSKTKSPRTTQIPHAALNALAWLVFIAMAAGCRSLPQNSLGTHDSSRWGKDIAAFEAVDRTNPPPKGCILFTGSSSIRMWKGLSNDFPNLPVVNRGFGGSQIADLVNLAPRILLPYEPRQIVIYSGGNDLNAKKSPELVYGDFVALVYEIRRSLPDTRIAYISVAPNMARWEQIEQVRRLNTKVAAYCRKHDIDFINVFPLMLGPDGMPKPDIYLKDNLHMNAKGYQLWKEEVGKYLERQ